MRRGQENAKISVEEIRCRATKWPCGPPQNPKTPLNRIFLKLKYNKMEEEFKDCIDYKLEKKIVLPHGIRAIIYSYMTL